MNNSSKTKQETLVKVAEKASSDSQYLTTFTDPSVHRVNIVMFKSPANFRLTPVGFNFMKKYWKEYRFESDYPSKEQLIKLFKYCRSPYYIGNKFFSIFSKEDAMFIELSSVSDWIDSL